MYGHSGLGPLDEQVAAVRTDPDSDEAAERLRAGARKEGLFVTLAESLIERGDLLSARNEPMRAADAYVEAALVYEEDLSDLDSAAQCCERVLEIDAGHRQALFTLGLLLHDLGRWEDLIALYRQRIRQTEDPGEQTTFHMYVAEILESRLDDSNAAFEEVMAAARLAPKNIRIVTRLQRLGEETRRVEEVAVSIGNLILHQEDPRVRAALSLRLAELHLGPLKDDNRALAYLRAALADDGGNPTVLHEVQDVFRERDRFDALAALLEESVEDRRVGPHRVRLERELARIYERELSDPDRALGALTRAAEHADSDRELLDEIMRLGAKTGEFDRVAETFARVIHRTDNLLLKTYLRLKLGHLLVTELDKPQEAAGIYEAILNDDPGHAEARRRLAQLQKPHRQIPEPDGDLTADLQLEVVILPPMPEPAPPIPGNSAGLRVDRDGRSEEEPASPADVPLLEDFTLKPAVQDEDTTDYAAPDYADADYEDQLYGPETETEVFPKMPVVAMERSAAARAQEVRQQGSGDGRLAAIQRELQAATRANDAERIEVLLEEIYAINRELGQDDRAFFAMVRLVQIEPTESRLDELIRLGREAESHALTLETLDQAIPGLPHESYVRFQQRAAELEADDLANPEAALERLALTYERTEGDPVVRDGWLALLKREGRFDDMVGVLLDAARRAADPREADRLVLEAAEVRQHDERDAAGALELLRGYLQDAPERHAVRDQAIRLLERLEDWEALSHTLEEAIGRREEADRVPLRLKKARVEAEQLEDLASAERTIRLGLEERARDDALLEALGDILERAGRPEELIDVLLLRVEGLSSPRIRRALWLKAARTAEQALSDPKLALEMLGRVLAEDAADAEVLAVVERLCRAVGDWSGVRSVLEARVASEEEPDARAALYTEISEIAASRDGDFDAAVEALERALEADPTHAPALLLSAEFAERRGNVEEAVDVLLRLANQDDPSTRSEAHLRIGLLRETCLSDPEGARFAYQAAYEADGSRLEVIIALLEATERAEDWVEAQELAERAAHTADDPRATASFWRRAGQIAKERLGDGDRALACYAHVLSADPDDLDAQATIGMLYLSRRDFESAQGHLFGAASAFSDPERAAELFFAAAEAARNLGREEAVIAALEAVLVRLPQDRTALEQLLDRFFVREEWERVYEIGAHLILHHERALTAVERSAVYAKMARAKLSDDQPAAALRVARRAHDLHGRAAEPLALMAEAWEQVGEPGEAAECLREWGARLDEVPPRKGALLKAGRLVADQVGDLARAAGLLAEAQALDPGDVEVAELLCEYRLAVGDPLGAADALMIAARFKEGGERADLLVEAARATLAGGEDRARVKGLLEDALVLVPAHQEALDDLMVLLEFDGELRDLARTLEQSADALEREVETNNRPDRPDRPPSLDRVRVLREQALQIYHERLNDPVSAIALGRKLGDDDSPEPELRERHARLLDEALTRGGADRDALGRAALGSWAGLVECDPGYVEGLERVRDLGRRAGDGRVARVAEELLVAVGAAPMNGLTEDDDQAHLEISEALQIPEDPDEANGVGPLFEALGHAPLLAFAEEARYPRLRKKDAVAETVLGREVRQPIDCAAAILGIPPPMIFLVDEADQPFIPALVGDQPAVVVSLSATGVFDSCELRFFAGRALSLLRPRALSLTSLPVPLLREAVVGLGCLDRAEALFVEQKTARKRARVVERHLSSADHETAVRLAQAYFDRENARGFLAAKTAVLRTADRVGLVTSGSVLAALRAMARGIDAPASRERKPPLIRFAASRAFADLVRRLPVASASEFARDPSPA